MIPEDFAGSYSAMSDDELLRLACDFNDLKAEARSALNGELQRRQLLQADIDAYNQHLLLTKPGELPGKQKFVARSFNGFGTGIYGKRDFRPDGSFLTTKWLIFFWIPVAPIRSLRLLKIGSGSTRPFRLWASTYVIHQTTGPNVKQVLFVYAFLVMLVLAIAAQDYVPSPVAYLLFVCVCFVPWLLRRFARQRGDKSLNSSPTP